MSKVTVNIYGGLGNQMFQYACGRALSLQNGSELILEVSDLLTINRNIYRPFSLSHFNHKGVVADVKAYSLRSVVRLLQRFIGQSLYRQFYVGYHPRVHSMHGNVYLNGYFQSERYFTNIADTIRSDFTLREKLTGKAAEFEHRVMNDPDSASLHVRRGDFVNHSSFRDLANKDYYVRAITKMRERVPNARFYIFSDDIAWCKDNLELPSDSVFVSSPDFKDYEELWIMSKCRHHIMANSTFSWWGAWLGTYPETVTICPKRWDWNDETNTVHIEKILPEWIAL